MSKIIELRAKRNTLWEQTKNFLEENNIFRQMAHVIRTSSGTRKIPVANDTMEASWIDEGEAIPETNTHFKQVILGAYKQGAMIKASN